MSVSFIDSNVLIYLFDKSNPEKRQIADKICMDAVANRSGVISFQVVQEVLCVISSKLNPPAPPAETHDFLSKTLMPLWRIMPSLELYQRTVDLQTRYRYGFYDSLILSAALEAGCETLFSEDMQPGQQIEKLTIVNPF